MSPVQILFKIGITAFRSAVIIVLAILEVSSLHSAIIAPDHSCAMLVNILINLSPITLKIMLAHYRLKPAGILEQTTLRKVSAVDTVGSYVLYS